MMVKVIVGSGLRVSRFRKFAGYVDEKGTVRMGWSRDLERCSRVEEFGVQEVSLPDL